MKEPLVNGTSTCIVLSKCCFLTASLFHTSADLTSLSSFSPTFWESSDCLLRVCFSVFAACLPHSCVCVSCFSSLVFLRVCLVCIGLSGKGFLCLQMLFLHTWGLSKAAVYLPTAFLQISLDCTTSRSSSYCMQWQIVSSLKLRYFKPNLTSYSPVPLLVTQ